MSKRCINPECEAFKELQKFPDEETICPLCGGDLAPDEEEVKDQQETPKEGEGLEPAVPSKAGEAIIPEKEVVASLVVTSMGGFFEYILGEGVTYIGRDDPNSHWYPQIKLNEDRTVSRKHCSIVKEGEEYFIEDQGSKHGTRLNGEEIKGQGKKRLNNGDKINLGEGSEITFYLSENNKEVSNAERAKPKEET
ncbi:FHA domain-containing protein [Caldisericum sp. AR60]|uniref:FHA domain-containing protein n=1 Tax=Caldisericum sp. AR60 TaxID=3397852 RepID=UPI0039FD6313